MDEVITTFSEYHSIWVSFSKRINLDPYIQKFKGDTVFMEKLYNKHHKGLDMDIKDIHNYYYARMMRFDGFEAMKRVQLKNNIDEYENSLRNIKKQLELSIEEYQNN
jgi:hypothetical protein